MKFQKAKENIFPGYSWKLNDPVWGYFHNDFPITYLESTVMIMKMIVELFLDKFLDKDNQQKGTFKEPSLA